MVKKQKTEEIIVRSMRSGFTWFDNPIVDDWLPILGTEIFAIYSVYCRRAMNNTQSTKLPQEVIAEHLQISRSTVSEAMVVLELCDLIKVVRRAGGISTIYLKDTSPITPEVIEKIRTRCDDDQKHAKIHKMILSRLEKFSSLSAKIEALMETKIVAIPASNTPINLPQTETLTVTHRNSTNPLTVQWQQIKTQLQGQLPQATYDTWVKQTELVQIEGNQWLIQCESTFAQDWLENRLNGTLMRTVASVAGQAVELKFVVNDKELGKLNG